MIIVFNRNNVYKDQCFCKHELLLWTCRSFKIKILEYLDGQYPYNFEFGKDKGHAYLSTLLR